MAIVLATGPTTPAVAQSVTGGSGASGAAAAESQAAPSIVGRWSGQIVIRTGGLGLPPADKIVLDIAACGRAFCGRVVEADGRCAARVLEVASQPEARPALDARRASGSTPSHTGKLALAGGPQIRVDLYLEGGADGRPMRLGLREADTPLYSRRIGDVVSASFDRSGPAGCPAQTS